MKQSHSRNSNQALELWIFFSLRFLFRYEIFMLLKTSHKLIFFFSLSFDGRITWIDFLFNSLRPLSRMSRVSPRHRRQQVDPIKPSKSVGEWISREFRSKFKIPKASSRIVCLSLSELLFLRLTFCFNHSFSINGGNFFSTRTKQREVV